MDTPRILPPAGQRRIAATKDGVTLVDGQAVLAQLHEARDRMGIWALRHPVSVEMHPAVWARLPPEVAREVMEGFMIITDDEPPIDQMTLR